MTSTTSTNTNSGSGSSAQTNSGENGGAGGDSVNNMNATGNGNNSIASSAHGSGTIEVEFKRIEGRHGWHRFYQEIREYCDREANEKQFGTSESEKPHNRCLNRYRDVNPYDHSRIIIHRGSIDYINANLVKLERAERKYILTQGPLGDTVGHFWLMVWEQNTKAILMLNKLMEKKQVKCHLYWPDKKGTENALKLDEVKLTVEFIRCEEYKNFCRRWFKLTDLESNQSREIIQFHYTTWPDFGVPSSPVAFLQFLKQVRDSGALDPDVGPAVVHCSAGIGRSGTFCLVDCSLVLIEKEGEVNVSVQDVLYELRRYRMGLIQTADQLYFSYQAIIEGIKLLKDSEFLNYKESPIISNDADRHEHYMAEIPPPLPPRTNSLLPMAGFSAAGALTLNLRAAQNKPLPNIPASESFNDDLYAPDNEEQQNKNKSTDALNNFINNEKIAESMSNRPLPPLPPQDPLERVHESESDENELYDDDSDEDDDDDLIHAAEDEDDVNANAINENETQTNSQSSSGGDNNAGEVHEMKLLNGIEGASRSLNKSPENELKRRKRVERQTNIEQKVNEIKRKQREAEESKQTAKKRRSIVTYIAAGVVVGVICVYAYTKFA